EDESVLDQPEKKKRGDRVNPRQFYPWLSTQFKFLEMEYGLRQFKLEKEEEDVAFSGDHAVDYYQLLPLGPFALMTLWLAVVAFRRSPGNDVAAPIPAGGGGAGMGSPLVPALSEPEEKVEGIKLVDEPTPASEPQWMPPPVQQAPPLRETTPADVTTELTPPDDSSDSGIFSVGPLSAPEPGEPPIPLVDEDESTGIEEKEDREEKPRDGDP
ncbi:MAG: hypothetical protein GY953_55845, partial [bacterium]|nr:hypothetical protein [bacterium]